MKSPLDSIKIYDKYIFSQVLINSCVSILLFTVVWIAPEMLLNTIKDVLGGRYSVGTGIMILVCALPLILGKAFPVGLLLGSLFTFDKLSKDSELTIFRAVGLSFWRIAAPVLALSLIFTGLCFVTGDKLIPYAEMQTSKIEGVHILTQYIYTQKDESGVPTMAVVVPKYENGTMENVVVLDFADKRYIDMQGMAHIYTGKTGKNMGDKWLLSEVTEYDVSPDGIFQQISHLPSLEILNGEDAENAYILLTYSDKRDREINNKDLWHYVKLLKHEELDEDYRLMLNKYLQRFFHPFVCVLLALMGCLLGFSKPREQKMIGFVIAIGTIFLYYITLPFFDLMAEKGVLPPLLTALIPPIAFMFAIYAFYKSKDL